MFVVAAWNAPSNSVGHILLNRNQAKVHQLHSPTRGQNVRNAADGFLKRKQSIEPSEGEIMKMLTPRQWQQLMADGHSANLAKHRVAQYARAVLCEVPPGETISTNTLGERLYPRVDGESLRSDTARVAIYKYLAALAKNELSDCCEKGEVDGHYMGKPRRPWIWYTPDNTEMCCMCGQFIPPEPEENEHAAETKEEETETAEEKIYHPSR